MIKKIKAWWKRHKPDHINNYTRGYEDGKRVGQETFRGQETYTSEQLEKAYTLGYNDGKRDGLAVAREQATNSLKEILWQQNNPKKQQVKK